MPELDDANIAINLPLPVYGDEASQDVEIQFNTRYTGAEDAAKFVQTLMHGSHVKVEEETRKRRRIDERIEQERRLARANETVEFRINGAQTTMQFRIKRADQFKRSLEAYAQQNNKQSENLKLFFDGCWVPAHSSANDVRYCGLVEMQEAYECLQIDMESGEILEVYELAR
ncbi:hypothetical protein PRZ48_008463 [Zasmidium cellare]|uniref:UBX domain-containing protein n=1 Tax=Zasmidium cellare TaxID=395010 RepID=A0ABR0EFK0_ZASCE|nr:hypothetical protein PRZ48_008463 [Zasmidium cellare]